MSSNDNVTDYDPFFLKVYFKTVWGEIVTTIPICFGPHKNEATAEEWGSAFETVVEAYWSDGRQKVSVVNIVAIRHGNKEPGDLTHPINREMSETISELFGFLERSRMRMQFNLQEIDERTDHNDKGVS